MIAAVFDCMVFLQAATNERGPAFACLSLAESNELTLHVSPAILAEVRDVLARPAVQARFPHLTSDRITVFLLKVASLAIIATDVADTGFPMRDPDDAAYLNLAVAAGASHLVTRDKDLLDLMREPTFAAAYPQLQVVDPVSFLALVRQKEAP